MMKSKHLYIVLFISTVIVLSSCATTSMEVPEGFAQLDSSEDDLRFISPEGFRVRIYRRNNMPEQNINFWVDAYVHHMENQGYQEFEDAQLIDSQIGKLSVHTWLVSLTGKDYLYAHAIGLQGKEIIIVEFAGPLDQYEEYQNSLMSALASIHS